MNDAPIRIFYDFVDPLSWLLAEQLERAPDPVRARLEWIGFELRPPPMPLTDLDDPGIAPRWTEARDRIGAMEGDFGLERPLSPPRLVPWTRKAHEVVMHAGEHGLADAMRAVVFQAYMLDGVDIGRVDRLVELAIDVGLDRTNTRAVLDVDRFEGEIARQRRDALEAGIETTPVIEVGDDRRTGFHDAALLGTFLGT